MKYTNIIRVFGFTYVALGGVIVLGAIMGFRFNLQHIATLIGLASFYLGVLTVIIGDIVEGI